ncbi:VOC family protein [Hoeflea prorocentri]|uniref:VOC family protein n=1 Tax=Hoeflea prorocentri TaxID=1922333 RepID=A0A9X3ZJB7_9HYPH|nr:VOC family protein [Hoeflea prorocentri]MCY6382771.1 VOC family protein [Hoeflea prorocentri]MDA5400571.1 VOC family protein [Hoeflea prorocentri]
MPSIAYVTLIVPSYEEALAFFVGVLNFDLIDDNRMPDGKRWVLVRPSDGSGTALRIAEPANARQAARIGDQAGGRVSFFLSTGDFQADHARMLKNGVVFLEEPRTEPYGTVAVFLDPFGNRWDLLQPVD